LSIGSLLPTSPTQLTKVNCTLCGKIVYMSPEVIQAEENRRQSIIITDSPTTPTPNLIRNPTITPSPQRSVPGGCAASKLLKSVTLPSLVGVVAGATGSRSNPPTPRHSLDSVTYIGSGPVTPTTVRMPLHGMHAFFQHVNLLICRSCSQWVDHLHAYHPRTLKALLDEPGPVRKPFAGKSILFLYPSRSGIDVCILLFLHVFPISFFSRFTQVKSTAHIQPLPRRASWVLRGWRWFMISEPHLSSGSSTMLF
jgi:hypothetical protein